LWPCNTVLFIEPSSREKRRKVCNNTNNIEEQYSNRLIRFLILNNPIIKGGINKIGLISITILSFDPEE
jgi:hypothetical protein